MANQELVDFIKSQVDRGVQVNDVRNALLQNGWQEADVNEALSSSGHGEAVPQTAAPVQAPAQPAQAAQPMATTETMTAQPGMQSPGMVGAQPTEPGQPVDMFDAVENPQPGAPVGQPGQMGQIAQFGQQIGQQVGQALRSPIGTTMNMTKQVVGNTMQAAEDVKNVVEEQMPGVFNNPSITAEGKPLAAGQSVVPDGKLSDGSSSGVEVKEGLGTMARIMVFTLIILGIGALVGGGIWGYYYVTRSPERVAQLFLNGISTSQSMMFGGSFTEDGEEVYSFTGAIDTTTPALNLSLDTKDANSDVQYGMELLAVGEDMYGSFHTNVGTGAVSELNDAWMELDGQAAATLITTVLPVSGTISTQMALPVSETDRQVLATAIQEHPFITNFEKGNRKTVNGEPSIVYRGTIDGEQLKLFTESVERQLRNAGFTSTLVGRMKSSQMPYDGAKVTLTMDRQSYQLYELTVDLGEGKLLNMVFTPLQETITAPENIISAERMFELLTAVDEEAETATEETTEESTEDAEESESEESTEETEEETTEEVEESVEEETTEEVAEETTEEPEEEEVDPSEIDTDGDGLSDEDEDRYGTNPTNEDTDGDGFLDGEEVENGYNPLGSGKLEE